MTNTKMVRELTKFTRTLPAHSKMSASELVEAYQRYSSGAFTRTVEARDLEFTPRVVKLIVRAFQRSTGKRVVIYFKKGQPGLKVMSFERMTKCLETINHASRGLRRYYDNGEHLKRHKK